VQHYVVATQTGQSIVPGVTDVGNHGDDTVTTIPLPFPVYIYGTPYTSANVSSNGNIQFGTTDTTFTNVCLPWLSHGAAFFPYWDDLLTDDASGLTGRGIFTTVTGEAPNRTFYIEWRAKYFFDKTKEANFEFAYNEADQVLKTIYGTVFNGNTSSTAGVQESGTGIFDQYGCNGTGGAISSGRAVLYLPPLAPTISSLSPKAGALGGGQSVVINGTNLLGADWVSFGGTLAPSFTVNSSTKITAVIPAHAAGTFHVKVHTPVGLSSATNHDLFTYEGPPTVTSVSPRAGPLGGGQSVVILGTNFIGTKWVSFGGTFTTNFTVNSATKITAITPAHAAGNFLHVKVNTVVGLSAASAADVYTYEGPPTVTGVSPSTGPTGGGQSVIITGTNFIGAKWVSFGGTLAPSFTVNSPTQITVTTPAHSAGIFHVKVNTVVGLSAATNADRYTFQ